MKKIINNPQDVVTEMCKGIAYAHPELEINLKYKIITRRERNRKKVCLISGGGSGHEPAHAGYVGKGMLDAAVCGDVFASPSQIQVYQAIKETASEKGTLLIIKNYSGDIMNFKNAAFLAQEDGLLVDYVIVNDDIAVQDSLYTVGRRGVAGTVLVHKIAGAATEAGLTLSEVKAVAEKAINNVKSLGFALSSCIAPAKGSAIFDLGDNEIEFGIGIHGEPGIKREEILKANELAKKTVIPITKELELSNGDEIAVIVNGFGGTPLQELYLMNYSVHILLAGEGFKVVKTLVGNYMTSLDMAGASVSILKLDAELKELLLASCSAPNLKVMENEKTYVAYKDVDNQTVAKGTYTIQTNADYAVVTQNKITLNNMIFIVDSLSECIIKNEIPFCELDSHAGDGDFGMSIAKGFKQLKQEWHYILENHTQNIGAFLNACSLVIMEYCGGASGPIWGSAFRAAGNFAGSRSEMDIRSLSEMMAAIIKGIQATGERSFGRGAVVGDKTLIDALVPAADSLFNSGEKMTDLKTAGKDFVSAAVEGAKKTEQIIARMGRAGTVGERSLGHPDAGAFALGVIFTEIYNSLVYY